MNFANIFKTYWDFDITRIEILFSILIFTATSILGVVIFSRDSRSWTTRFFVMLAAIFDAYIVINYLSLHPPGSDLSRLFWIRAVMAIASFKTPILFLLVYNFPHREFIIPKKILIPTVLIMFVTAVISMGATVFTGMSYDNGQPTPIPGPGMALFALNFFGFLVLSFVALVRRYRKSLDMEKKQISSLMVGIFLSFGLILVFSFIFVVVLKQSSFVFLAPSFLLFLLGSIGYSIVRYRLFGVKIIAANVLVGCLLIVLFGKVTVADTIMDFSIDASVFGLVLIFSILLLKSILREVEQREKLEKLATQLESANDKLKELDHLKSEFLSFASHQIKAPLAAIKGFSTLIYDGTYGPVPDKVKEASIKIKESVDRMTQLVTDSLSIRKIEEGKMEYKLEKLNAVSIIQNLFEELKPLAEKKKLEFSFEPHPGGGWINADPQAIRQVFQNLIENAIKYTDSGFVKVKTESYAGQFSFTVSDSGHGIAKETIPHLFEEFKRESGVKTIEGTGLGLFIAHEITTAHKGEIWVESDGPGKGSKFIVRIPLT